MSYTPTQWVTGDKVTATKLNKLENGVANAGGTLIITDNGTALDKTFAEIYDAVHSGTPCYIHYTGNESTQSLDNDYGYHVELLPVVSVFKYNTYYRVYALVVGTQSFNNVDFAGIPVAWSYQAQVSTGYPTFHRRVFTNGQYCDMNTTRF